MGYRIGAYYNGTELFWIASREKGKKKSLIAGVKVSAPTLGYAIGAIGVLNNTYKIKNAKVIFSLPTHDVWAEVKEFEESQGAKFIEAVRSAAGKDIPNLKNDAVISYQEYSTQHANRVIIGAIDRDKVNMIKKQVTSYPPGTFKVEFSIISLIRLWKITEPSIVLHLDEGELLLVLFDPLPSFFYSTPFTLKGKKKLSSDDINTINGELRRAVVFFRSLRQAPKNVKIFASGFYSKDLVARLKTTTPVTRVKKNIKEEISIITDDYFTALGAVLRKDGETELNFMAAESKKSKKLMWVLSALVIVGTILIIFGILSLKK